MYYSQINSFIFFKNNLVLEFNSWSSGLILSFTENNRLLKLYSIGVISFNGIFYNIDTIGVYVL